MSLENFFDKKEIDTLGPIESIERKMLEVLEEYEARNPQGLRYNQWYRKTSEKITRGKVQEEKKAGLGKDTFNKKVKTLRERKFVILDGLVYRINRETTFSVVRNLCKETEAVIRKELDMLRQLRNKGVDINVATQMFRRTIRVATNLFPLGLWASTPYFDRGDVRYGNSIIEECTKSILSICKKIVEWLKGDIELTKEVMKEALQDPTCLPQTKKLVEEFLKNI